MPHDPAEEQEKTMAILGLAANFGKDLPEPLLDLWLDLLAPYPSGLVRAAVRKVIESYAYKTLPPFAVLKTALDELEGRGEKAMELAALAEWGALMGAVRERGRYAKPALHPTTEQVLRLLGGWEAACSWSLAELDFKRRDFCRTWPEADAKTALLPLGAAGILAGALQLEAEQSCGGSHEY